MAEGHGEKRICGTCVGSKVANAVSVDQCIIFDKTPVYRMPVA